MKDIEIIRINGHREQDSDGFTYVHGKFKSGRTKHSRNKNQTAFCIRYHKRSAKQAAFKRCMKEI